MTQTDNLYAPPKTRSEDLVPESVEPVFFPCGLTKLAVMFLCTLGLYQFYWFYKNWKCAARLLGESYWAPVRALFFPLTAYFLFQKIDFKGLQHDVHLAGGAGPLAVAVFFLNMSSRFPDPWWLAAFLGVLPLMAVQGAVNELNAKVAPDAERNTRFSVANIIGATLGGLVLLLAIIGLLMPAPEQ